MTDQTKGSPRPRRCRVRSMVVALGGIVAASMLSAAPANAAVPGQVQKAAPGQVQQPAAQVQQAEAGRSAAPAPTPPKGMEGTPVARLSDLRPPNADDARRTTSGGTAPDALSAAPAATPAGSIVLIMNNNVWTARPDGTGLRPVTADGTSARAYRSPSMDDGGRIVALLGTGPRPDIVRMDSQGSVLNRFAPPVTALSVDWAKVSPDGSKIAYSWMTARTDCSFNPCHTQFIHTLAYTQATASKIVPGTGGPADVRSANWMSNGRTVIGAAQAQTVRYHDITKAAAADWFTDCPPAGICDDEHHLGNYDPAENRQGTRLGEIVVDDLWSSAQNPTYLTVRATSNANAGNPPAQPAENCLIEGPTTSDADLNAGKLSMSHPSWSPDGRSMVFQVFSGTQPQIWLLTFPTAVAQCGNATGGSVVLGATEPSFSPAAFVPAATFTALPTTRVYDSVSNKIGTTPVAIQIAGRGGVPADATAVVINTEVFNPSTAGYVRVTPYGQDAGVAVQEYTKGQTISNLVIVKLNAGKIQAKVSAGNARILMDVSGYYRGSDAGARFNALPTTRVYDSVSNKIGTTPVAIQIAGRAGVPANATAVVVNTEVFNPSAAGYVRVTPYGQDAGVAVQEYTRGQTISNLVIVKLNQGKIQAKVSAGNARILMDVSGYYAPGTSGSFTALPTTRVYDSVSNKIGTTPVAIQVAGRGGVPADATAVVINTEVFNPSTAGYVRVTPYGQDSGVAVQEYARGQTISNLVIVKLNAGKIQAKVSAGNARILMDVSGYYRGPASGS